MKKAKKSTAKSREKIFHQLGDLVNPIPYHRLSIEELEVVFEHEEERPLRVLCNGEIVPSNMNVPDFQAAFNAIHNRKKLENTFGKEDADKIISDIVATGVSWIKKGKRIEPPAK